LVRTNRARSRLRLSLGNMGEILVRKFVKPTKFFGSWTPHQRCFGQILPSQAESDVGTVGSGYRCAAGTRPLRFFGSGVATIGAYS
jgi:hypothetical protein